MKTFKLTPKGRECIIVGSSVVLKAIEDDVPFESLPFTPEELNQTLEHLTKGGYITEEN